MRRSSVAKPELSFLAEAGSILLIRLLLDSYLLYYVLQVERIVTFIILLPFLNLLKLIA